MPTLIRLLSVLALLAGTVLAVMWALVTFVEPQVVPLTVEVPIPSLHEPAAPQSAPPASEPTTEQGATAP